MTALLEFRESEGWHLDGKPIQRGDALEYFNPRTGHYVHVLFGDSLSRDVPMMCVLVDDELAFSRRIFPRVDQFRWPRA